MARGCGAIRSPTIPSATYGSRTRSRRLSTSARSARAPQEIDALGGDTRVVLLGDMGIGNTTAAAAITALLLGIAPEEVVGAGTGVSGDALSRKIEVVRDATRRAQEASGVQRTDPHRVVQAVGGKRSPRWWAPWRGRIERRMAVLVDGFIVSTAALALVRMCAEARSGIRLPLGRRGHAHVLAALDAPLLDLGMRLGEASARGRAALLDAARALTPAWRRSRARACRIARGPGLHDDAAGAARRPRSGDLPHARPGRQLPLRRGGLALGLCLVPVRGRRARRRPGRGVAARRSERRSSRRASPWASGCC